MNGREIIDRILRLVGTEEVEGLFNNEPPAPNPIILLEAEKLKVETARMIAERVKDYAQAIKLLAEADKIQGDQDLNWEKNQLALLKIMVEGELNPNKAIATPPIAPGGGASAAGVGLPPPLQSAPAVAMGV